MFKKTYILFFIFLTISCFKKSAKVNLVETLSLEEKGSAWTTNIPINLQEALAGRVTLDLPNVLIKQQDGYEEFVLDILEPDITFDWALFNYRLNPPTMRPIHEEQLKIKYRFSRDGTIWSEWNFDSGTLGHDELAPDKFAHRELSLVAPVATSLPNQYVEIKIISYSGNAGDTLFTNPNYNVIRNSRDETEGAYRLKKNNKMTIWDDECVDIPGIIPRENFLKPIQIALNINKWDPDGNDSNNNPNSLDEFPSVCHFYLHCPATKRKPHEQWKDVVRKIWYAHSIKGVEDENGDIVIYGDIAYHTLIDPTGMIWEGRTKSIETIESETYFAKGAHLKLANSRALGICLLSEDGDFSTDTITAAQKESLFQLIGYKMFQQNIADPRELLTHRSHEDAPRVTGHTLYPGVNKECPGKNIKDNLGQLREELWSYLVRECAEEDSDGDGVPDMIDNCPETPNTDQEDFDGDGVGDVCDDSDEDGIMDSEDDCYSTSLSDSDNDGIVDDCDNCPNDYNPDQRNFDGDEYGNACDNDMDGDGIPNSEDNCEAYYNPNQEDTDDDGVPDACEEIEDCDDAEAQTLQNAMISCIDGIMIDYNNIPSQEIKDQKNNCIENALASNPEGNQILNKYRKQKAWEEYPSYYTDCISELEYPLQLSPSQHSDVVNCATNKVLNNALELGWVSSMGDPSESSWNEFLVDQCECNIPYSIQRSQQIISVSQSALQCFNQTGELCIGNKLKVIYTRSYWENKISTHEAKIERLNDADCSTMELTSPW